MEYRCNITRILYDIESLAILNYIRIIVEDVAKEDSGTGRSANYKDLIIRMVLAMNNEDYLFKTYHYLLAKYRREKSSADDE